MKSAWQEQQEFNLMIFVLLEILILGIIALSSLAVLGVSE